MSSRSISDLIPSMQAMSAKHVELCHEKGVELLIYCTLRTNEEQDKLYAIGRTVKGSIVTNARAGDSAHNPDATGKAWAYDCCPLLHGKPIWDSKHPTWAIVGSCGEEAGLVWSGRWTGKLRETAHFQHPKWEKKSHL